MFVPIPDFAAQICGSSDFSLRENANSIVQFESFVARETGTIGVVKSGTKIVNGNTDSLLVEGPSG